jgi:choline-sulfatase
MSDEHGGMFSSAYGHPLVETPHMERLAEEGVTFDAAYCNAPLSVPSRICFMTGQHNWHCKGWDNATPMSSDAMTWAYLLRARGYDVALSGKMHLVGRDNLHGFRGQLARDLHSHLQHPIYLWKDGIPEATKPWPGVYEAGPGIHTHDDTAQGVVIPTGPGRTVEIEADDEAEKAAVAYLKEASQKRQPFALCVGPIAPHFPFVVPEPYFSRYFPEKADLPNNPPGHLENLPAAAQRLRTAFGFWGYTDEQVRRARAAYYGLISYVDDKIGRLLDTLDATGLAENTVVVYTSDHGDMLGEHGLWRKMSFYEQSGRIPMLVRWPSGIPAGRRIEQCTSLVDLTATVLDIGGVSVDEQKEQWEIDGDTLLPLMQGQGEEWKDEAFAEHNAHGTDRALAMIRRGPWKLCYGHGEPPELELYNLESDPGEFDNLAGRPEHREVQERLLSRLNQLWDAEKVTQEVLSSQEERYLIRNLAPEDGLF